MDAVDKALGVCFLLMIIGAVGFAVVDLFEEEQPAEVRLNNTEYGSIEVIDVRGCQYVLWHNGYGSDMEHFEKCKNH